jgi:hypothetical protein
MKSYKDFKSQINEVLKSNDPIEKWIDDFVHSKNPKFAGKTKAERIDMAKGAYYGAQKNEAYAASQNSTAVQDMEAVEYKGIGTDVVDKKKKLNPQPNLTTDKKQVKDFKEEAQCESCNCPKSKCKCNELDEKRGLWDNIHAKQKRIKNGSGEHMRKPGSKGAPSNQDLKNSQKTVKESFDYNFDMLEEAVKSIDQGEYDYEGQMSRTQLQTTMRNCQDLIGMIKNNDNMPEWVQSKITLAQDYITCVRDYLQSKEELGEEVQIDELSKDTLASYAKKSSHDARIKQHVAADMKSKATHARNPRKKETWTSIAGKYQSQAWKREKGHDKAVDKLTKEEAEQIDEAKSITFHEPAKFHDAVDKELHHNKSNFNVKMMSRDLNHIKNNIDKSGKFHGHADHVEQAQKFAKRHKLAHTIGESVQIDEISKKTLASYVNKASHDAASGAYQGKEYTAQSLQHTAAGDWDASKKKHNQATKEFNRANKRLANIPKATTKLAKEGFLNRSEEDDMQTLSAAEFYKKYGRNKSSHRKGRGVKTSDVEKYTEQVEESRGHKILNTFFKNREIAQRAFNGQNKPEEKKPVYNEKGIETPKVKTEDAYPTDEKWTDFDPKKHATNSKNKKGEK